MKSKNYVMVIFFLVGTLISCTDEHAEPNLIDNEAVSSLEKQVDETTNIIEKSVGIEVKPLTLSDSLAELDIKVTKNPSFKESIFDINSEKDISTGYIVLNNESDAQDIVAIEDYEIVWKDSFIEKTVRELLNIQKDIIMYSDLLLITEFHVGTDFPRFAIKTIADLEHFKNLKKLTLVGAKISDLTPLSNLSLTEFHLDNNASAGDYSLGNCTDLNPLKNMHTLEKLSITYSKLSDLSPLTGLKNLTDLDIRTTNVTNLNPLANLINLEKIYINNYTIDFSPLKTLKKVEVFPKLNSQTTRNNKYEQSDLVLNISLAVPEFNLRWFRTFNEIKVITDSFNEIDITKEADDYEIAFVNSSIEQIVRVLLDKYGQPLKKSDLDTIIDLDLSYKNLTNIDDLIHFENLEVLNLSNNKIASIEQLSKLKNLKDIDLSYNDIQNIKPLAGLSKLQNLDISDNTISDISALSDSASLLSLSIHNNNVSDISSLVNLKDLMILNISNNSISDIEVVKNFALLLSLRASENNISNIEPISKLTQLFELELGKNNISDISFISNLTKLETLNISYNAINSIEVVEKLTNLIGLNASNNNIENIDPLNKSNLLKSLILNNNKITDVNPLIKLTKLEILSLSDNNISDVSPLNELVELKIFGISDNMVNDISFVKEFINLIEFDFSNNQITDVSSLVEHPNLVTIYYWDNPIEDKEPLWTIPNADWQ